MTATPETAANRCTADPREDIGHGVSIERRYLDGKLDGIAYWHPDGKGGICGGERGAWIPFEKAPHGWQLESERPLTLSPSLLCPITGHHGFIRKGCWVPA